MQLTEGPNVRHRMVQSSARSKLRLPRDGAKCPIQGVLAKQVYKESLHCNANAISNNLTLLASEKQQQCFSDAVKETSLDGSPSHHQVLIRSHDLKTNSVNQTKAHDPEDKSLNQLCERSWRDFIHHMDQNMEIGPATLASLLHQCTRAMALNEGKLVHHHLIISHGCTILGDVLVQMYCTFGALKEAMALFATLDERNVPSWNVIIQAHVRKGDNKGAVRLFENMQQEGVTPDEFTFVYILSAFGRRVGLEDGRRIHAYVEESGFEADVHVGTALVSMYGKCASPDDARKMFQRMPKRDVVTWNVMITVCIQHGLGKEALHLFNQMQQKGVKPNKVTFLGILDACGGETTSNKGRLVHACIVENKFDSEVVVNNALLNMYGRSRALDDARKTFQIMASHNVVSWTAMISGHVAHGKGKEAVQLFFQMQQAGINPDKVTFVAVLEACTSHDLPMQGMLLHSYIIDNNMEPDILIGNTVVNMYGKCGSLKDAIEVFNRMSEQDVVTWTAMITAYIQQGQGPEAIQLLKRMQQEGVKPNKVTFVCTLDACASCEALTDGMQVHTCVLELGLIEDVDVGTSLINMYGKCGSLQYSWDLFNKMPEHNVVSWTAMITVCSYHGQAEEAVKLFNHMHQKGVIPNEVTYVSVLDACSKQASFVKGKQVHSCIVNSRFELNVAVGNSLINMYGKCGSLQHAHMVFSKMGGRNVVSWTSMMAVYAHHGQGHEALVLYEFMQRETIRPDKATFLCILDACTSCGALAKGEHVLHQFLECGFEFDSVIGTALINLYGKCGNLDDARRTFDRLPDQGVVSWTVMIAVCAQHGQCQEAIKRFYQMQHEGITAADKLTFVSILSACSHAGLIDEGQHFFTSMVWEHGIPPSIEHYVCMVDLFGRAGRLDEAETLLNSTPLQPTGELLMAFLGACRYKEDVERGEHYAKKMFRVDPTNAAPYVMLSNIYCAAQRGADVAIVVHYINCGDLPWQPGLNAAEAKGQLLGYSEDEGPHAQEEETYAQLLI